MVNWRRLAWSVMEEMETKEMKGGFSQRRGIWSKEAIYEEQTGQEEEKKKRRRNERRKRRM